MTLVVSALLLLVLLDWPGWRMVGEYTLQELHDAAEVRSQLEIIPESASLFVQPNLIPHVAHRREVVAIGREFDADVIGGHVLLTYVGDTWPLDSEQVSEMIDRYRRDPRYETLVNGPLFAFRELSGIDSRTP